MERRAPTPVCKVFLLCRQIFHDPVRQDWTLVAPIHQIFAPEFPVVEDLSVFARWTNAHGSYRVELQLRDLEGEVLWKGQLRQPFQVIDPLQVWVITMPHLPVHIPGPGKYEVALLADGSEVAVDVLQAHQVRSPGGAEG